MSTLQMCISDKHNLEQDRSLQRVFIATKNLIVVISHFFD